jgi:hypothetical protein
MSEFKLPRCPKDVLAAFESLPKEVLDKIDLKVIAFMLHEKSRSDLSAKSGSGATSRSPPTTFAGRS